MAFVVQDPTCRVKRITLCRVPDSHSTKENTVAPSRFMETGKIAVSSLGLQQSPTPAVPNHTWGLDDMGRKGLHRLELLVQGRT